MRYTIFSYDNSRSQSKPAFIITLGWTYLSPWAISIGAPSTSTIYPSIVRYIKLQGYLWNPGWIELAFTLIPEPSSTSFRNHPVQSRLPSGETNVRGWKYIYWQVHTNSSHITTLQTPSESRNERTWGRSANSERPLRAPPCPFQGCWCDPSSWKSSKLIAS